MKGKKLERLYAQLDSVLEACLQAERSAMKVLGEIKHELAAYRAKQDDRLRHAEGDLSEPSVASDNGTAKGDDNKSREEPV